MTVLHVVDQGSGEQLGTIMRADDGSVQTTDLGGPVFEQVREGKGWNDQETFQALVEGGWSNAYVSVRAAADSRE